MSAILTSRSPDLARLEAEGFRLRIVQGAADHLLIEGVPAVTTSRQVVLGTLYCPLVLDADQRVRNPVSGHQCWWIGSEAPCDETGRTMRELISNESAEDKGDHILTVVAFSRKRADKTDYADLHEKIWAYIELIWHPARVIEPKCDPRMDKPVAAVVEAQKRVFRYPDNATTRAGIGAATAKLICERVAIIGIGGTGSYILDLIAKTPIQAIHIWDGDTFELHNAFRSPGAPTSDQLTDPMKVDWFGDIYDRMHMGIVRHPCRVDASNIKELAGFDFVFVAIDDGEARKLILEALIAMKVSFIDVGIDVDLDKNGVLQAMCRYTVGTPECYDHILQVVPMAKIPAEGIYSNIQVADLNMNNAAFAVMKWKKLRGFYADEMHEHHSLYTVPTHALTKEDRG
jgi:hypothetical protein